MEELQATYDFACNSSLTKMHIGVNWQELKSPSIKSQFIVGEQLSLIRCSIKMLVTELSNQNFRAVKEANLNPQLVFSENGWIPQKALNINFIINNNVTKLPFSN